MLTLYQDGQPVDSMKVITGTNELPTPLIASVMYYITYNPRWHAPDHLVRKTIAPNVLHLGMPYLKSHGYHVIDQWSENPTEIEASSKFWLWLALGVLFPPRGLITLLTFLLTPRDKSVVAHKN